MEKGIAAPLGGYPYYGGSGIYYEHDFTKVFQHAINSPEWLGHSLIDTGYITREDAIEIVKDRTNHINDNLHYEQYYECHHMDNDSYLCPNLPQ